MNQKMRKKKTNRAISTMTVAVFLFYFVFFVLFMFFCFCFFCFVLFCFWFVLFCFCGVTQNFGIGTLTVNDSCALMYYKFHWK